MSDAGLAATLMLAGHLALLSLLTIGGLPAVLPDIHRFVVELHPWMTSAQFSAMVALGQAAPGPNFLIVALIGYYVGGVLGALAATVAICGPSALLTFAVARLARTDAAARWKGIAQRGLAPLTIGLMISSGYVIGQGAQPGVAGWVIVGVTAVLSAVTRWNPLWFIAAGAVAGVVI